MFCLPAAVLKPIPLKLKISARMLQLRRGEFSYTCEISMAENSVSVTATSTNANGMCIAYNGKSANFKYLDMEYEIVSDKIDDTNPAKAVYEAFAVIKEAFRIMPPKQPMDSDMMAKRLLAALLCFKGMIIPINLFNSKKQI